MSWKASGYVKGLQCSPDGQRLTRTEKLVMLVLADSYDEHRGYAHPSIKLLSEQCLLSERMVRYCLRSLEKSGLLTTDQGSGVGHGSRYGFPGIKPNGATIAPFTKVERGQVDAVKGAIAIAPEPLGAVYIERDPTKTSNKQKQELHFEQDVLPWMEKVWRSHPNCRRRKWEDPKYPSSFERNEEFEGAEVFRSAYLQYLGATEKPNIIDFLYSRPKPPSKEVRRRHRPTPREITGLSDVERLQKLIDEQKR